MKTWCILFIMVFAISQVICGTLPSKMNNGKLRPPIQLSVIQTYPVGTTLEVDGNRVCGGSNEIIIRYFPFDEVNPDSLKLNKTESEPDNYAPFVFLTNVQTFKLLSNETIHNEEHPPIKISKSNDVYPYGSYHLGVTNSVSVKNTEPPKVQQSTPTESNSIFEIVTKHPSISFNKSNISMPTGTRTSAGMRTTWDVSTNNPISNNDSHVFTSTPTNNNWNNNTSSSTTKTNLIMSNVTHPLGNTNHSTSVDEFEKINSATQKSFKNLTADFTTDGETVSFISNITQLNDIPSTTILTKPKLGFVKSENESVIIHINHYSKKFHQSVMPISRIKIF